MGKIVNNVEISKLDHQGRGISYIDEKITFIENALPGEIVDVEILEEKKKFKVAKTIYVQKECNKRIESICPYYGKCGGCDLLHLSYSEQIKFKEKKVKEILSRFAGLDTSLVEPILSSDKVTYYRNKVTLKVKNKVGYYQKKSNDFVAIDHCKIAHPKINEIIKHIEDKVVLDHIYEIVIRVTSASDSMVIFKVSGEVRKEHIIQDLKQVTNNIILYRNRKYETIYGNGYLTEKIGNYFFEISPTAFFQVNSYMLHSLYNKTMEYANIQEKETVLDLYCGTGTLGIYASQMASKVLGIEINHEAVNNAKTNAKINRVKNIQFLCKDVSSITESYNPDLIIVDPPRGGLDENAISFVLKEKPKKLVYVSCDPATLARDLKKITEQLYEVIEVTPVDMFPQTSHVECVVLLTRTEK